MSESDALSLAMSQLYWGGGGGGASVMGTVLVALTDVW